MSPEDILCTLCQPPPIRISHERSNATRYLFPPSGYVLTPLVFLLLKQVRPLSTHGTYSLEHSYTWKVLYPLCAWVHHSQPSKRFRGTSHKVTSTPNALPMAYNTQCQHHLSPCHEQEPKFIYPTRIRVVSLSVSALTVPS